MYDEDEYNEYEEYQEEKKEVCPIEEMLLLRLIQCSKSTKIGFIDQGFPLAYGQLAHKGLTKRIENGFQVTPDGFAFLSKWHEKASRI